MTRMPYCCRTIVSRCLSCGNKRQFDEMQMTLCVCWTTLWSRFSLAWQIVPLPSLTVITPSTSKNSTFILLALRSCCCQASEKRSCYGCYEWISRDSYTRFGTGALTSKTCKPCADQARCLLLPCLPAVNIFVIQAILSSDSFKRFFPGRFKFR